MTYQWAIVHHDPESAYGVSFPDLEGCFAAADDEDGIMAAAIEALDLYLEDADCPVASDLHTVREACKEDLAEGAYLIQVPYIQRDTVTVRINLSLERGLVNAIDQAATRTGLNRSAFMALASRKLINGEL